MNENQVLDMLVREAVYHYIVMMDTKEETTLIEHRSRYRQTMHIATQLMKLCNRNDFMMLVRSQHTEFEENCKKIGL